MNTDQKKYDVKRVVILMSAYNGSRYLPAQLDSILAQDHEHTTLLVRNDGSQDGGETMGILNKYKHDHPEKVYVLDGENLGFADSFSTLIRTALEMYPNADYFAFSDQDDVWKPEKLSRALRMMESCSDEVPVAYCSNTMRVDAELNPMGLSWNPAEVSLSKKRALVQNFATGCTMVFNRKAATVYNDFKPVHIMMHDFLMYQICTFLGELVWDPESYILYRQHSSNQIGRPGLWGRMKNRFKGHFSEHNLERQNRMLIESYGHLMNEKDRKLVQSFVDYRKSLWKTCRLLLDRKIGYTSLERDFFYRLKVAMKTV